MENIQIIEKKNEDLTSLMKELELLKEMILDLHNITSSQSDKMDKVEDLTREINQSVIQIENEVEQIKNEEEKNKKISMIRDYFIPLASMVSVNLPLFWLLGPKVGLIGSFFSFIFFKIF